MSTKAKPASQDPIEAEQQLETFIEKFEQSVALLLRSVRKAVRKRLPTANELVYDNYNFFVIGYCSTDRPSDCILSITAAANGVGLSFYHGADLPDPHKVLLGSGTQNRFVRIKRLAVLARPELDELIVAAIAHARTPLPEEGQGRLIIRSISEKQRPRRSDLN